MRLLVQHRKLVAAVALVFFFAAQAYADIVIRSLIVNPSDTMKRKVPFKTFLPKEVKPENIVDMGDLDIAFDPAEGAYYVYKEYELSPKESVQVEVVMQDVWKIAQSEIDYYRAQAKSLVKALSNTDYLDRANYLGNSIESKLSQIEFRQRVPNATPGGYISDYRENVRLLDSVKADMAAAKSLLAEAKAIAPMITWKLIVAIVVFLGFLGVVFFIIWQRQIKTLGEIGEEPGPEAPGAGPMMEGERRRAQEERKSELEDIEERLKEKPEDK